MLDNFNLVFVDLKEFDVFYEEKMLNYLNFCRYYVGFVVFKSCVEFFVVVESLKFIFVVIMG